MARHHYEPDLQLFPGDALIDTNSKFAKSALWGAPGRVQSRKYR